MLRWGHHHPIRWRETRTSMDDACVHRHHGCRYNLPDRVPQHDSNGTSMFKKSHLQRKHTNRQSQVWGRFIAGIGNGGNTAAAPVWHVETSHQSQKGIAVVKEMSVNVLGFVISNFITLGCSGITTEAQWRFPLGACSHLGVIFVANSR